MLGAEHRRFYEHEDGLSLSAIGLVGQANTHRPMADQCRWRLAERRLAPDLRAAGWAGSG
jgi:hypothetical protein